jgi:hypothetical protein
MRRVICVLVVTLSVMVLAACAPSRAGYKPLIVGLIDKGSEAPYHQGVAYPVVDLADVASRSPAFAGVVVNATWAQVEPSAGTFDFATLDASLALVAAYNAAHANAPLRVRLRLFAAYTAPAWAKTLDGTAIIVPAKPPSNTGGTLGRWWEPNYRAAWAALQRVLANRYDTNPVLSDVAVSSCATLTAEPFVMAPSAIAAAKLDGWTTAAQQACLDGAFTDYAPWKHTAIYYPMNPLAGDEVITTEVSQRCANSAAVGGPWCILANNALSPISATTGRSASVYAEIDTLRAAHPLATPVAFQMYSPNNTTYCAALGVAVAHGAQSVELWPSTPGQSGFTTVPTSTLIKWSSALRASTAPNCAT